MRFALVMFVMCLAAAPVPALAEAAAEKVPTAKENAAERLRVLSDMVNLNEMADVYLKQCDDYEARTKERPNFMTNSRATADALTAELVKQDKTLKPDAAGQQVAAQQQKARETFAALVAKEGCEGKEAGIAQNHWSIFSQSPPDFYLRFLAAIEN